MHMTLVSSLHGGYAVRRFEDTASWRGVERWAHLLATV